jgi:hypothetical protein
MIFSSKIKKKTEKSAFIFTSNSSHQLPTTMFLNKVSWNFQIELPFVPPLFHVERNFINLKTFCLNVFIPFVLHFSFIVFY